MISTEQYAASIVEKYQVIPGAGSPPHRAADALMPALKEWANQYLLGITLSGAYAHNTAISLSSSVDVLITLRPIPDMEMKAVFWNLFEFLTKHNFKAHTRQVSMQVESEGFKVDLIPMYRDKAGCRLHNKRSEVAVRTDPARHVQLVANSGRTQEICALKIWRERNGLKFPSLYLELTVLKALEGERFGQLSENVLTALRYIASRFEQALVRDPADAGNIVSNDLSVEEKKLRPRRLIARFTMTIGRRLCGRSPTEREPALKLSFLYPKSKAPLKPKAGLNGAPIATFCFRTLFTVLHSELYHRRASATFVLWGLGYRFYVRMLLQ